MKIMEKITEYLLRKPAAQGRPYGGDTLDSYYASLNEWKEVLNQFNYVDPELTDYLVHRINAAERHLVAVLLLARKEGVTAWPAKGLVEPVIMVQQYAE